MTESFIGEIRMVGFTYAPENWANADGQMLQIAQYQSLFALYGTTYGGDGQQTFALPDLRGRVPLHVGHGPGLPSYPQGSMGGTPSVVLEEDQMPPHTHPAAAHAKAAVADQTSPVDHFWAEPGRAAYAADRDATMHEDAVQVLENAGGGQAHYNMQPYLTIQFCVSLFGIWPSRP